MRLPGLGSRRPDQGPFVAEGTMSTNAVLYAASILIWGSTWFAIEFQLGVVDPSVSVAYRFALAGVLILGWLVVRRQPVLPPRRGLAMIAATSALNFSLNYLLVYMATGLLPSGLVATAGSALTIMNVINARLFLGQPVRPKVVAGGLVGVLGVLLLFWPEIDAHGWGAGAAVGLALVMASNYSASLGNMAAARARKAEVPVITMTAWGMVGGAALMATLCVVRGVPFTFDPSPGYIGSLLYLAVFGSVAAFLCYFTLLGRIGADRAGYVAVMIPIVALSISTVFEGYQWTAAGAVGLALAVGGNLLVMAPSREPGRGSGPEPAVEVPVETAVPAGKTGA